MNLEILEKKKGLLLKIGVPVVAIILMSTTFSMGLSSAKTDLNGEKLKYEEIVKKIDTAKTDLKTYESTVTEIQNKIKTINGEYASKKTEFDEAKKILEQKESSQAEITKLNSELDAKKKESGSLDSDIKTKKDELAKIENGIVLKKDAPKQLPAGQFVVGKDLPEGRYKVVPVGRGSNFQVYDSSGSIVINTIVSTSGIGVPEYVALLSTGYIIDAHSPFKYVPVE